MHYVFTDHLGSVNVIVSDGGTIEQELSYDAWGNRRDPATWVNLTTAPANLITNRGFTGHEHMDDFKLINMNGRVYDPVLGRFLSPDPFISNPLSTQDYNRYSYCINNPLMFTDPSGYILPDFAAPAEDVYPYCGNSDILNNGGGGGGSMFMSPVPAGKSGINYGTEGRYGYKYLGGGVYIDVATGKTVSPDAAINYMMNSAGRDVILHYSSSDNILYINPDYALVTGNEINIFLSKEDRNSAEAALNAPLNAYLMDYKEGSGYGMSYGGPGDPSVGGDLWAVSAAQGALAFMAVDVSVLDPSDAVWIKWAGYAITATAATIVINYYVGKGNTNYPGPWSYTVPDKTSSYYNTPQQPNFNPGDYENIVKWAAGLTLGVRFMEKMYEGTNTYPYNTCPTDATRLAPNKLPVPIQPDLP